MTKKIIQFGNTFGNLIESISYFSHYNITESDVIVVNISDLFGLIDTMLNRADFSNVLDFIDNRYTVFREFYFHGGLSVIILNKYPIYQSPQHYENINLLEKIGVGSPAYNIKSRIGQSEETLPHSLKLPKDMSFNYSCVFSNLTDNVLVRLQKTKEAVGFFEPVENGGIIVLPDFHFSDESYLYEDRMEELLSIFYNFHTSLNALQGNVEIPKWLSEFHIGKEGQETKNLNALTIKKEKIEQAIEEQNKVLLGFTKLKSLLILGDTALEGAVKECLELIGFKVLQPIGFDDDLIIEENEFIAAIEVKGVTKSGTTKHAMQLEKWVSEYALNHEEEAKGILILNTYKDKPLAERNQIHFPPNMVEYSTKRNHCLMLTFDLLNICVDYQEGLIKKDAVITLLKNTTGVLDYALKFK